ncbi:MAG: hypothetical protein CL607_22425 [Anaerolineaceae bacterium]|nr:hypothetical protein [Anaerolineaceae bacterium]
MTRKRKQKPVNLKEKVGGKLYSILLVIIGPVVCLLVTIVAFAITSELGTQHNLITLQTAINEQCPALEVVVDRKYYKWDSLDAISSYHTQDIECVSFPHPDSTYWNWKCSCSLAPQGS